MHGALRALGVTLLLEVPFVALCYPRQRLRLAGVALLANTLTNLTLNVGLPAIPALRGNHVLVGEILAVVVEALAYAAAARPRDIGKALGLAVGNALSYELGGSLARLLFGSATDVVGRSERHGTTTPRRHVEPPREVDEIAAERKAEQRPLGLLVKFNLDPRPRDPAPPTHVRSVPLIALRGVVASWRRGDLSGSLRGTYDAVHSAHLFPGARSTGVTCAPSTVPSPGVVTTRSSPSSPATIATSAPMSRSICTGTILSRLPGPTTATRTPRASARMAGEGT